MRVSEANVNDSRERGSSTKLWATASVIFNVALVAWLLRPAPVPAAASVPRPRPSIEPSVASPAATAAGSVSDHTSAATSFSWTQVDSADPRQLMANLRAAGCSEQVVRDLVSAELNRTWRERARAIWRQPVTPYWQKLTYAYSPDQLKQLQALSEEHAATYKEVMGVAFNPWETMKMFSLQLRPTELELLVYPADKREAALAALADAGLQAKEEEIGMNNANPSSEANLKFFQEKMKVLAGVLSPEELVEYRLRNSEYARTLRSELRYFNCTTQEFVMLLDAREVDGPMAFYPDWKDRRGFEQVRKILGEDRAKEYEHATDRVYTSARSAVERAGLPVERAEQAWQIAENTRTAADAVAKNTSLSVDDRKRQLQTLRGQADSQLTELLGSFSRSVSVDLRVALDDMESRMKP